MTVPAWCRVHPDLFHACPDGGTGPRTLAVPAKADLTVGSRVQFIGPLPDEPFGLPQRPRRPYYVVKDLCDRRTYDLPAAVGIGPADEGTAFRAYLVDLRIAR